MLAWGFEYMSLGENYPRIETEPKRGRKGVREAALLVFRHPTEALRACEDQVYRDELEMRQEMSTGTKQVPVAG